MQAIEIKKEYLKEEVFDRVGVIAISRDSHNPHWYHIHDDEDVPENGYDIAIHIS